MADETDPVAEIDKRIEGIARARLESGHTCYLSHVGIELGDDLNKLKAHTGLSLADFIRTRMSDRFVMISVGPNKNVLALWPAGEEYTPEQAARDAAPARSRFDRELWLAFALPASGHRRFFDPVERKRHEADAPESENWIEVPNEVLRAGGSEYDVVEIERALRAWLTEHNLSEGEFRDSHRLARDGTIAPGAGRGLSTTNALEVVLSALDRRQLQTTALNLDVVESLLRKRV